MMRGIEVTLCLLGLLVVGTFATWSPMQPKYVHLAMDGTTTGMIVSWYTIVNTSSIVQYGTTSGSYPFSASGYTLSYVAKGGYHHHTLLSGLTADTTYYYQVGNGQLWSSESTFITPPSTPREFTIGVYGDMGVLFSTDTIYDMHELTNNGTLNWIWHVGDISYADDYAIVSPELYEPIWNLWFDLVEPTTSIVPYMVLPGNHEFSCENPICTNFSQNFIAYNNRFLVPHTVSGSPTNMWYSFDYAGVHFVCISTETDYPDAPFPSVFGDQLTWLESDLASVNRTKTPWLIVGGHRPLYSGAIPFSVNNGSFHYAINNSRTLQEYFEPLFYKYQVDLYLCGHVHAYERQFPLFGNQTTGYSYVNPKSTVYIVAGAAGNIEYHETNFPPELSPWTAYRNDTLFGYGTLTFFNETVLQWNWYESDTQQLVDQMTLVKDSTTF